MEDLTGRRFGRLVVLGEAPKQRIVCACDCGATKTVSRYNVLSGNTTSCGCFHREQLATRSFKHGHSVGYIRTTEHMAWHSMLNRCSNPNHPKFMRNGGRGIIVCDRWRGSFSDFLADVGRKPSPELTLRRMDVDGDYEPGNCRWA